MPEQARTHKSMRHDTLNVDNSQQKYGGQDFGLSDERQAGKERQREMPGNA